MKKSIFLSFILFGLYLNFSTYAYADDLPLLADKSDTEKLNDALKKIEELSNQLETQRKINKQMVNRLNTLFERRSKAQNSEKFEIATLDINSKSAPSNGELDGSTSAIEQALGNQGLVLLPKGSYRLTPSATWVHAGSGTSRRDSYIGRINLQAGLPWGMMASVSAPYIWRDYDYGSNDGVGDISVSLSKKLNNETNSFPSLVANIGFTDNNGKDSFNDVPIGSGFRSANASLSAVKRFDPVVVFGNINYSHVFDRNVNIRNGHKNYDLFVAPGDSYGLGFGMSLAATPAISIDAGLSYNYIEGTRFQPRGMSRFKSPQLNVGYFNLGANFLITKDLLLNLYGSAGVTDDAADLILGVALPYRF